MSTPDTGGRRTGIGGTEPAAPAEAIAALARQVDRLHAAVAVADLPGMRRDVHDLAVTVAGLTEQIADLADPGAPAGRPVSWLAPAPDPVAGGENGSASGASTVDLAGLLEGLTRWVGQVYGWFADGRLPDCWLWHPDVVEELLWLWQAWQAAYHSREASINRAADWHDRHRPGVARRIHTTTTTTTTTGGCSLHEHLLPEPPPTAPAADAVDRIAGWWATDRTQPPPTPTDTQIEAADHDRAVRNGRHR
jgi:hypothetical protein